MAEDKQQPEHPRTGPAAQTEAAQRRERQAAALRENLRRRKARERSRADRTGHPGDGPTER